MPKITLRAVVDVPEATAPVLKSWFEGYVRGLTGQIAGLEVHSVEAVTEGANEQAARGRSRQGAGPR